MNVLVLGAGGMAGHVLALFLNEAGFSVDTLSATTKLDQATCLLDVTDIKRFEKFLKAKKYDVVINCIGLLVKECEEQKDLAVYLNSYLPLFLERQFQNTSTRVIHLSSDAVFAKGVTPYQEDSPLGSNEGFYGLSKALGEINNSKDLTIRLSIIGPSLQSDKSGLFNWFMAQKGQVPGYSKALWSGITTVELAKATKSAIEEGTLSGIYHLVPERSISKFELLELLQKVFQRPGIELVADDSVAIDRTMISTRKDVKYRVSDYPNMIEEMRVWMNAHKELYGRYFD